MLHISWKFNRPTWEALKGVKYVQVHALLIVKVTTYESLMQTLLIMLSLYPWKLSCFEFEIGHHRIGIAARHFHQLLVKIYEQYFMHWAIVVTSRFVMYTDYVNIFLRNNGIFFKCLDFIHVGTLMCWLFRDQQRRLC